jgi:SNF2 family DNA or RNA helicase
VEEKLVIAELTEVQKKAYRIILEKNFSTLVQREDVCKEELRQLENLLIQLRSCCNHPYKIVSSLGEDKILTGSHADVTFDEISTDDRSFVEASGKLTALDNLLAQLWKEQDLADIENRDTSKIAILCHSLGGVTLIQQYLSCIYPDRPYKKLDALSSGNERMDFSKDITSHQDAVELEAPVVPRSSVYLIETGSLSYDIDLSYVSHFILYDSGLVPLGDVQLIGRSRRCDEKGFSLFRLVTSKTFEEALVAKSYSELQYEEEQGHVEGQVQNQNQGIQAKSSPTIIFPPVGVALEVRSSPSFFHLWFRN